MNPLIDEKSLIGTEQFSENFTLLSVNFPYKDGTENTGNVYTSELQSSSNLRQPPSGTCRGWCDHYPLVF